MASSDRLVGGGGGAPSEPVGGDEGTLEEVKGPAVRPVRLVPSLFAHRKATVLFDYPSFVGERRAVSEPTRRLPDGSRRRMRFRIANAHEYNCVRNALLRAGFERTEGESWNMLWSRHLRADEYQRLNPYQKVCHFPGSWELGRKDRLARNVDRMVRLHGEAFQIAAKTYHLPGERNKLKSDMEANPRSLWILKPPASSCGRGIRVVSAAAMGLQSALPEPDKVCIAQRYIANPFLINDRKFDLRIYVLVTSFDPLRIYLFDNGLARFATEPFSTSTAHGGRAIRNRFAHLTNFSVNKKSTNFDWNQDATEDGKGSKWSLKALLLHLREERGVDTDALMVRIRDLIIKTFLCCENTVASMFNRCFRNRTDELSAGTPCFELYGFDILLDQDLRPWLIEVNLGPSLSSSSPLDRTIKTVLLTDIFHLVGFVPYDPQQLQKATLRRKRERLLGFSQRGAGKRSDERDTGGDEDHPDGHDDHGGRDADDGGAAGDRGRALDHRKRGSDPSKKTAHGDSRGSALTRSAAARSDRAGAASGAEDGAGTLGGAAASSPTVRSFPIRPTSATSVSWRKGASFRGSLSRVNWNALTGGSVGADERSTRAPVSSSSSSSASSSSSPSSSSSSSSRPAGAWESLSLRAEISARRTEMRFSYSEMW